MPTEAITKTTWCDPHPAYTNPGLPCSLARATPYAGIAWKNVRKSVEVFYKVASLPDPPLHFVVGKDAIEAIRTKLNQLQKVVETYEAWSEGLEERPTSNESE